MDLTNHSTNEIYENLPEKLVTDINEDNEKNFNNSAISLYLHEISKYPILTPDEEQELTKKIANGDEQARDKFIKSNLRLVVAIAKKYRSENVEFLDLIQEGNVGLLKAVKLFDYTKGYRFSTYAAMSIKRTILKAFEEKRIQLNAYSSNIVSLSTPKYSKDENELGDFIKDEKETPEEAFFKMSKKEFLNNLISGSNLNEMEKTVIRLRYDLVHQKINTLESVAKMMGKNRESVRLLEKRACVKLKRAAEKFW